MDGLARGRGDRRHRPQERGHGHHRLRHRPGVDDRAACEGDRAPCGQDVLQDAIEDQHGVQEDGPQEADATKVDRGCRRGGRRGPSQLGFPLPVDVPLFVVDHHANSSDEWPAHAVAPEGEASSTCEMVLGILLRSNSVIQVAWAEMLYAGIVTDTGRFRHGSPSGLRAAARLLDECWIDTDDVLTTIEGSGMPADQRKRILRSMGGMEIHHCGGLLVTTAKGGSHESRIASSMVGSGADASIVAKTLDGGGLRITTRASQGAVRAGVDLGEVMSSMATTKGGQGGGHAGAAGWSGEVPTSEAFAYILASIGAQARGTNDE